MENTLFTSSSQLSPGVGNPLNPRPISPLASESATIETLVSTPLEPVSLKSDEPPVVSTEKLQMHDDDDEIVKPKSCCANLNKLVLILALICFALFLCSLAYIISNVPGFNAQRISRFGVPVSSGDDLFSLEQRIDAEFFNLTHPNNEDLLVVLARRGASVHDVLLRSRDGKTWRSIVLKGGDQSHFGSVRFGFEDPLNSMTMTYQLPSDYPFLNSYEEDWVMYADVTRPSRVRFVRKLVQVIYEFTSKASNEFAMITMVAAPSDLPIIADPTNNIYFNLRGNGDLSTHYLNVSLAEPLGMADGERVEQGRLTGSQRVDRLVNVHNYFYRLAGAGLGKNHIATLFESETKTSMKIFADHTGLVIDPFGDGSSENNGNHATSQPNLRGIRLSARQSSVIEPMSLHGPILIVHPNQGIHTTWWQIDQ